MRNALVNCFERPIVLLNENERNNVWNAFGLLHIHSDKPTSSLNCGAFVKPRIQTALLSFTVQLPPMRICNGYTLVGFISVEYEESGSGVEDFEKMESSDQVGIVWSSNLVSVRNVN